MRRPTERMVGCLWAVLAILLVVLLVAATNRETVTQIFEGGIRTALIEHQYGGSTTDATMRIGTSATTSITFAGTVGVLGPVPAVQVVAATDTITANACGGVKRISAASAVTTSTTDTFTAPSAANAGCWMLVCNVDDTDNITLDVNTNFKALGAANIVLTAFDCTQVYSDGVFWYSAGGLVAN